ncbi:MAG: DUF4340 domain-containing protein [Desulfatirhabdiaceae bacterium]|nr:DUF4340 domain-containing protein [Desulfatirhabdiaceae bacterium]
MMKLKKEYFFIALAIVLLAGYLTVRKTDRTEYQLPAIAKVAASDFIRIEIARQEGTVVLEKKDTTWLIQPEAYLADSGKVTAMLDDLEKLSLTALVSDSKSYSRYDLEPDKVIRVKAWAGDGLKRDIQIGKPAPTFQHTFVRVGDAPEIYHAQQNLKNAFDQTADKLRDKTVLAFSLEEISEIAITREGKQTVIRKNETAQPPEAPAPAPAQGSPPVDAAVKPAQIQWLTDQGKPADLSKINRLLSTLSRLPCESYLEGKNTSDLSNPISIIVIKGKKDYTLTLYAKTEKDTTNYPASSSETGSVFTLSDRQAEPLIADPSTLIGNAENQEKKS